VDPQALNLGSHGEFTITISLNSGYDPNLILAASVRAYGAAPLSFKVKGNGDLMIKFNRDDLVGGPPVGDSVPFIVTGLYQDGSVFQGWDYIKVLGE
jgi:hypothetical protein